MASPQNGTGLQYSTSDVAASGTNSIDSLLRGLKWGNFKGTAATLSYSFPLAAASWETGSSYSALNEPGTGFALTAAQQVAARSALESWAAVANLSFTQVTETASSVGDIRFAWTSATMGSSSAWAYEPSYYYADGGDVWLSYSVLGSQPASSWLSGGSSYFTLIHEVGHALGLKHPFEGTPVLSGAENTAQYTVMAYGAHPHGTFIRVTGTAGAYSATAIEVKPDTPMLDDMLAMQYLYGANTSYHPSDDVYTFDPAAPFFRTLWDAGGRDTISVANFTKPCTVDLQEGHFSKITIESDTPPPGIVWNGPAPVATYDGTDNLAIAYGAVIENATGGSGNDTLIGNSANNALTGGAGDDGLTGNAGVDTAVYTQGRASYAISHSGVTWAVQDRTGAEGHDTLSGMERLTFTDARLALDLGVAEAAGKTALLLGAVLGTAALGRASLVGMVLNYFDTGASLRDAGALLVEAGVTAALAGGTGNEALVRLLFQNLVGTPPDAATTTALLGLFDVSTYTQGRFVADVAALELNQQHVGLVGLAQTGLVFG